MEVHNLSIFVCCILMFMKSRRRRLGITNKFFNLHEHLGREKMLKKQMLLIISMICTPPRTDIIRSIRRNVRNTGWWELVWNNYDDKRFKDAFRMTRPTFLYILAFAIMTLASTVLHNLCIELDDKGAKSWDLTYDSSSNTERPRNLVREMLLMTSCQGLHNKNPTASIIRDKLKDKFWNERQSGNVF